MRKYLASLFSGLIVAVVVFPLAGCIAHQPNSGGGGGTTVVTVSPTTATVSGGGTQNLTATVTGSGLAGVSWNVNGIPSGSATLGLITPNPTCSGASPTLCAIYTAPATVPNPPTVSITAASLDTSGTLSSPATFTITPSQVAVSVLPATFTMQAGASTTYTATVTGSSNVGVEWSVNSIPDGDSNVGMITAVSTATGSIATYTAPPPIDATTQSPASITISAKPMANAFLEADAKAMILPIIVTVSPASTVQIPVSGTQTFTATVSGATDTTVTNWQVNQIPGGNSTFGTIVSSGGNSALYTAPATVSAAPFPLIITAASNADSNSVGSVLGNVHVTVTVTPASDTIGQGANLQYSAVVSGTTNQSVQWSAAGGAGAFDSPADNAGLFVASEFSTGQTTIAGTVTATSTFDQFQFETASITVQGTDPLGSVSNVQTLPSSQCPADSNGGLANGTCYQMDVSCPDVADLTSYLKVNTPPAGVTPTGTVLFLIGSGGNGLYDSYWTYGYETVEMVNNGSSANPPTPSFNTVQISFGLPFTANQPNGWLQGPGGVRRLACRYATIADWVYNNPKHINPSSVATTSAPMCGTGNSGGSAALSYALYNYGLGSANTNGPAREFNMVDLTSGPVTTRLDQGCVCNTLQIGPPVPNCPVGGQSTTMCYVPSEAAIIDPAYQIQNQSNQPTLCSEGLSGTNTSQAVRMASDSIEYAPTKNPAISLSPNLSMFMRFGGMDTTTGVPQGMTWWKGVNPPQQPQCTLEADHEIPNLSKGATDIANDITTYCH